MKVLQQAWEWVSTCNGGATAGLEAWPLLPVVGGALVPATWTSKVVDWDLEDLPSVAMTKLLHRLGLRCVDYSTCL